MKHYLITIAGEALTAIIKADTVLPMRMRGEPDFIVPVTPKVFWARSQNAKEDATEKLDVLGVLGY